jgi:hypothetical protein
MRRVADVGEHRHRRQPVLGVDPEIADRAGQQVIDSGLGGQHRMSGGEL